MNAKTITNICTAVETGCMLVLGGISIYWITRCDKAERELTETKMKLGSSEMLNVLKDVKIDVLLKELDKLKSKITEEES